MRVFYFIVTVLAILLPVVSIDGHATADRGGLELFADYSGPVKDPNLSDDRTVLRSRPVSVRFDAMAGDDKPGGGRSVDRLRLSLFNDAAFTAVFDRLEQNPSGSQTWIGHLEGVAMSQVILVHHDGLMAGNISLQGAFYQVRYVDNGVHSIRQIDQSKFPESADALIPPEPKTVPDTGPMKDDGSTVDVLVVYTPAARSAVGGASAMSTLIDLAVSETNTSYQNSGINHRLRLVYKTEVSYTEQGFSADLNNLTGTTDGYMDNVHTLRTQYGADEVVLLVNGTSLCGIAWLMTTVSTSFASRAFAVVSRSCATGIYTFAHEIGHNMGARHDRYVDNANTPYDTSHGYLNVSSRWRTIMAYNDQCTASGTSCTRIPYWSNPSITYQGNALGVATGSASAADNRSTLNNTAYTVANFKASIDSTVTTYPNVPYYPKNTIVVSPYWQTDNDTYTFISVSHPSLSGMASAIGVKFSARNLAGVTVNIASFTVTADTHQKLFITATNATAYTGINSTTIPSANFMVNPYYLITGNLVATPVASHPTVKSTSGGHSDGFRDITMLSMWGAVIAASTASGFPMEFIGDLADSRNPSSSSTVSAGVN